MKQPGMTSKLTTAGLLALTLALVAPMQVVAGPMTVIESDINGMSLLVTADSDQDILALSIRVVGPGDFVFEDRIERATYEWVPPRGLPDGRYTWEAWIVTAKPGAPNIAPPGVAQSSAITQIAAEREMATPLSAKPQQVDLAEIPIERFYHAEDKNVQSVHGSFSIDNGLMLEISNEGESQLRSGSTGEPGLIQRLAGAVLDLLVPSAAAQVAGPYDRITMEREISTDGPRIWWDSRNDGVLVHWWNLQANEDRFRIWDNQTSQDSFYIETGARRNSIYIRGQNSGERTQPRIGIGTSAPAMELDISSSRPSIRLHDTFESTSVFISNENASRLELTFRSGYSNSEDPACGGAFCRSNPFTIERPSSTTQARRQDQAIYIGANGGVGIKGEPAGEYLHAHSAAWIQGNLWASNNTMVIATDETFTDYIAHTSDDDFWQTLTVKPGVGLRQPFAINKNAADDALVIGEGGNIGAGTASPDHSLHIVSDGGLGQIRVTETNGSNGLTMFAIENSGHPRFRLRNSTLNSNWDFRTAGSGSSEQFQITNISDGQSNFLFRLFKSGDLEVEGDVTANGVLLTSTRDAKTDFAPLDVNDVLDRLALLEISQWRYKHEDETSVHFGPVAEEFHEIFGLSDGKHLNLIDTNGITFAAIQALSAQNEELMERLERLESALQ